MAEKAQLIADLKAKHEATRALIADLDPGLVIHGDSGWRLRDIIAHMAVWYGVRVRSLQQWQTGDTYLVPGGDVEAFNMQTVADRAEWSYDAVFAEWESEFAALMDVLAAMPPEQFAQEMTLPWNAVGPVSLFVERLVEHQRDHYDEIHAVV
ncbi:MAG: DinB family protein [Anaerolineae bacterium]|nr:DinB family protein [Anaerolineae bacterium]